MFATFDSEPSFKANSHGTAFHAKKVFKFVTKLLKIISATKAFFGGSTSFGRKPFGRQTFRRRSTEGGMLTNQQSTKHCVGQMSVDQMTWS
jgi:hypothetical protein